MEIAMSYPVTDTETKKLAKRDLVNFAFMLSLRPEPKADSYKHFPTMRPANS